MTKKSMKETEAAPVEQPDETTIPEAVAAEAVPVDQDGIDDGGVEAEEVDDDGTPETDPANENPAELAADASSSTEGNQPEARQAPDDTAGGDPVADQQDNPASVTSSPDLETDPTDEEPATGADMLTHLAQRITDMLVWHRADLIAVLSRYYGLQMTRSIDGVSVTMAGITATSPQIGPSGEYQALDNWANAARRHVLELQAVPNA